MELKLSFGTVHVEDQLSEKVDRQALHTAVMVKGYTDRLEKAQGDFKLKVEEQMSEAVRVETCKRQALFIVKHNFDLEGLQLWEYLKTHAMSADSNKLNQAIDALGKGEEGYGVERQSTSLIKKPSSTDTNTFPGNSSNASHQMNTCVSTHSGWQN